LKRVKVIFKKKGNLARFVRLQGKKKDKMGVFEKGKSRPSLSAPNNTPSVHSSKSAATPLAFTVRCNKLTHRV